MFQYVARGKVSVKARPFIMVTLCGAVPNEIKTKAWAPANIGGAQKKLQPHHWLSSTTRPRCQVHRIALMADLPLRRSDGCVEWEFLSLERSVGIVGTYCLQVPVRFHYGRVTRHAVLKPDLRRLSPRRRGIRPWLGL